MRIFRDRTGSEPPTPRLDEESRWYTEHTALLISTLKWALLGAAAGLCAGLGTKAFLWALTASARLVAGIRLGPLPYYVLLPLALPACVWLIRTFAPTAKGHGTEAVIAAVHQRSGRIDVRVAPVKLLATVLTLAFGGSVGKEGPCAQIGAGIASLFADVLRLNDEDRRRLVICGIGGGFAAVFGTPVSGALFGIEVLYLGRIEYSVFFPCLISGIVAHLVCGVRAPVPAVHQSLASFQQSEVVFFAIAFGAFFGLAALLLVEAMRAIEKGLRRFEGHPYAVACGGGIFLALFYEVAGAQYAGLGAETIEAALSGAVQIALFAFLWKIIASAVTLETGGSGGIVTVLFFIGATSGAALARVFHLPVGALAAFGFVAVVAAAANTPIAAAVMGMELLPTELGVYAALAAATAFLTVGHRSVYASQKIGLSKSAGLDVRMDVPIGELTRSGVRIRRGSLTERVLRRSGQQPPPKSETPPG
ncbi:MAG TPA: chloride channel protein [Thermoanaerobaculia bacterium]